MDENLMNELGIERRVVVSEYLTVPRQTVQGLCETIVSAFRQHKDKPFRIQYTRGEGLIVERMIPESQVDAENSFITPWEMIRQHAEIALREIEETPEVALCRAAMQLAEKDYEVTMVVARSRDQADRWFPSGKVDGILRVPFIEDNDTPENFLVICGSQSGKMIQQIEYAVLCRMT